MAKTDMVCPFSNRICEECSVYRGRHYYLSLCSHYRGYIGSSREDAPPGTNHASANFKTMWELIERIRTPASPEVKPKNIALKVINMEDGTARVCQLDDAKTWDWNNPQMMRIISGIHVTSWDKLVEVSLRKAEKGSQEVEIYEAPRFILLGGG